MAYTEKLPSGKYRGVYRLRDGSRRSVGTFNYKKAAQRAADAAEVEAESPKWRDPKAALLPWGEWCDEWWPTRAVEPGTLARDEWTLKHDLIPKWANVALSDITRFSVKAWAKELADRGLAPATVKRRVYLLSASLNAAIDAEVIDYNPAFKIKILDGEQDTRRYLNGKELQALLAQFGVPTTLLLAEEMLTTQVGTGLRWGELSGLQIPRVDMKRQVLRVAEVWDRQTGQLKMYPKGKRQRDVPIPDWAVPMLKRAIGERTEGFVFRAEGGGVVTYNNFRYRVWAPATGRAGVAGASNHDLRHTYASMLIQNGVPIAVVGALLGHRAPQTTAIYANLQGLPADPILANYAMGIIDRLEILRGANVGKR